MAANTLVGYTLFNIVAAAVIAQSFIRHKRPSILMMGCGVVIWSCSGLVATLGGFKQPQKTVSVNHIITVHNCCVWLASFCHLAGVSMSLNWQVAPRRPGLVVAVAYQLSTATAAAIAVAAFSGWLPTFFTPGHGGTLVRHLVLASSVVMLALTAVIMLYLNRPASPYLHWYPNALILLAVGVTAILAQKANGSWIGWIGRGAQSLGGLYMLVAAVLSLEKPAAEGIPLWQALNQMRKRWVFSTALAAIAVSLGAAVRLLFLSFLGTAFPFASFYPAVFMTAAYGGLWPGLAATGLSLGMVYWMELVTGVPFDFSMMRTPIFVFFGISAAWGWKGIHGLQRRAIVAEADAAYALERAASAERLREASTKLQQSEQSFSVLVNTANEGVWILDAEGKTSYLNNRLAEILGRGADEVLGRNAHDFILHEDLLLFRHQLAILKRGEVCTWDLRIPRDDGAVTWLQASAAPFFSDENEVSGSFLMCTDISRLKETEEKLLQLNLNLEQMVFERSAELRRLNCELESFCYSISHELRAPIARLQAFSSLIREAVAGGDLEELPYLGERIEDGSKKMRVVIDSLLLINRLSRTEMQKEPVDLSQMARTIVAELGEEAPGRKVLLRIQPEMVASGDRSMMNICLRNLFENAFKYSSKNEFVSIEFGIDQGSGAYFVRDQGTGLDMTFCHRLFEPFSRLHQEQEFEGSGMGLSIVKRIVQRHGGRVWAEGRPGEGACFFFTLEDTSCGGWYGSTGGNHEQPVAVAC
ncbi:sensor histidine kinase [Geomonas azotofigens]|uniref:sensor histidine kinase n=1 Tax=Geomonas azotofigens TaxID=2843196 RepID=UPI001C11CAA8|nr:ATP-binding protein [Geomonas azotofigens]MBU5612842.1 PAS domain S-box protein [Geomonas azotofigens]